MSATLRSVSLLRSFGFALEGVSYLIRTQRSAQIEIVLGVVVTLVAAWLGMRDRHPVAKAAKDVAAAMVLIAAVGSVIVGVIVLGPRLASILVS